MDVFATLDTAALAAQLAGTRFAASILHFPTIGSTNTELLAAAASGAPDGVVYIADEQTSGRGRGGHTWHSASGSAHEPAGLYLSALIRTPFPIAEALKISLATGLAAQRAIHQVAAPHRDTVSSHIDIRWPNDLLIARKKCAGILVETAVDRDRLRYAVIGIGINLNQPSFPADLAPIATSLLIETGHPTARTPLIIALLRALDHELAALERSPGDLLARFSAASTWVHGKRVRVAENGGYTGVTDGLDEHGFLRVLGDDGRIHTVLSGGVREA